MASAAVRSKSVFLLSLIPMLVVEYLNGPYFVMQYLVSFLALQPPSWEKESWLLYFNCVLWLLVLCVSTMGLVCGLWMNRYLVILTCFFASLVSYCERWMAVVRRAMCYVCRQQLLQRTYPPKLLAVFLLNLAGLILIWPFLIIVQMILIRCIFRSHRLN